MLKKFIGRPVLATVISVILLILGIVGITQLPITQFPDIAPPSVQVTATYPGANAETVARAVAPSLEEAINGVENMTYMTSESSNDGSLNITIYFKLGTDPDQAAVNVQNRVAQANSQMPAEVIQAGITTVKQQNSMISLISLYSDSKDYDETFLQNYAKINIVPEIKRVSGVGQATVFGNKDYSMRIWLKPERLAAYNLSPQEVMAAIQDQNLEAAPGKFGEGSREAMELVIKYKGKLNEPTQFEDVVIRSNADGSVLRLKDVARVEFGSYNYSSGSQWRGRPSAGIAVYQMAGSNANQVQIAIQEVLKKASKSFPKAVKYDIPYSTKRSLDMSIDQVKHTLIEAFILVFVVVFIFLQDFRSTLIPAIAVPVAIVGTFFFMNVLGFSINLLTLFALVLAIGIVVDDAIVVVEAVHAKMEHKNLPAKAATLSAMSEITGAIVSITLVMSAVFLPIGFMKGPTGVFYRQFAYTLAIAIVISAVNALTLSPALCALFLKNAHVAHDGVQPVKKGWGNRFFAAFNTGFSALTGKYVKSLKFLTRHKWLSLGGLAVVFAATFWMLRTTPTGFIPDEDNDFLMATVTLPVGASLDRTSIALDSAEHMMRKMAPVENVMTISGINILTGAASPSAGICFIQLKPLKERGAVTNINAIAGMLNQQLTAIHAASFFVLTMCCTPYYNAAV